MNTATLSLQEFLELPEHRWGELPDYPYEFRDGEFIRLQERPYNSAIADNLQSVLRSLGISIKKIKAGTIQIQVQNPDETRRPDLVVLAEKPGDRALIKLSDPAPILAVEVISPRSREDDTVNKPRQYAARGIAEYWIIDPAAQTITLGVLLERTYQQVELQRGNVLRSKALPLTIPVDDVFDFD